MIHHVNSTLVRAYWQVGKYIVEYEQQGTGRAGYGKAVINTLSRRLVAEFGNGFTATNLRYFLSHMYIICIKATQEDIRNETYLMER